MSTRPAYTPLRNAVYFTFLLLALFEHMNRVSLLLAPQGDPLCQSSPIWVVMYSKASSIKLSSFVDFVDGVTDKQEK